MEQTSMSSQLRSTLFLVAALMLAGCGLSNDEIIVESKKCEAAGMEAQQMARMWDYRVVRIQCVPRYSK